MMKSLLSGILLLALIFPVQLFAQPIEVTIYCDDAYPPYSYMDRREARGIYTEIVKAVAERMPDYAITIEPVPWRRGLNYMQTGEGFALFPPYERPEERPFMDYNLKMLDEELVIIVRADSDITADSVWPDDFKDKVLGINAGFVFLDPWKDKGIFVIDESPDNRSAVLKLAHGRIDGYVNDRLAILSTISDLRAAGTNIPEVKAGPVISSEAGFLSITNEGGDRYPFKDDFSEKFGAILEEMRASGEIQAIVDDYLK